jgi:hypothetical protein
MDRAVRVGRRPQAGRCLASLAFVVLLSAAFWSGVLWIAAFFIRSGMLG